MINNIIAVMTGTNIAASNANRRRRAQLNYFESNSDTPAPVVKKREPRAED